MELYMEDDTICKDVWVLYKPKSDFINLSKLKYVELARELEAMKRKESQITESIVFFQHYFCQTKHFIW